MVRSASGRWVCPIALLVVILAFLGSDATQAQRPDLWGPTLNLSQLAGQSTSPAVGYEPTTAGYFVAWVDDGLGDRSEILGRRWNPGSGSWNPGLGSLPENLSNSPWTDDGPALSPDGQGGMLLLWTRRYAQFQGAPADGTDLMWRFWTGSGWSVEAVLMHADTYLPGTFGVIPVAMPDSLMLFIVFDRGYRTVSYQNGAWGEVSPWTYLSVSLAEIVRDSAGTLHAAAFGENSSQPGWDSWFLDAYYLAYDGATWSSPLNMSGTSGVAHDVGLALDQQGQLHFLWSDADSIYSSESLKSAIWERIYQTNVWTDNAEVTEYNPDQAIHDFALSSSSQGTLELVWNEGLIVSGMHTGLDVYYQERTLAAWKAEELVHTSDLLSMYPVLAAGSSNRMVTWQEGMSTEREVYFRTDAFPMIRTYMPVISR
jgi:hypothetical protein